jgi:hypothetical protein
MPEPPFQNDMRTQGLPPRRPHFASAGLSGSGSLALLTVTRPEELPDALRQHEKSVVIENTPANARLKRDFERLLRWQKWKDINQLLWLAALIFILFAHMVIATKYKLDISWYLKWAVFEMGGKITLTPSP